ncbi:DinB family protein [Paenibacillus sp. 598K]|uniref:DinB family protein n=1 Tax=Paenibacillus sp. 598K TaxID=1117987 RepID=UPI000FFF2CC8|nr:DinB family protein [Paenibacillus sp. 598K]
MIDYEKLPVSNSLSLLGILHERFFVLLQGLTSEDYERTMQTAVLGVITLDVALQRWLWHHRHHAAQIENLLRAEGWKL